MGRKIGIKLATESWYLTAHRISPAVDNDRFYLLQHLTMSAIASRFAFVPGADAPVKANPRANLADGRRLVVVLEVLRRPIELR